MTACDLLSGLNVLEAERLGKLVKEISPNLLIGFLSRRGYTLFEHTWVKRTWGEYSGDRIVGKMAWMLRPFGGAAFAPRLLRGVAAATCGTCTSGSACLARG